MQKLVSRLNSLKIRSIGGGLILLLAVASAANGQFGPPEPTAKEGKVALETGYFRFSSRGSAAGNIAGDVSKFKQNRIYVQAGYGFLKNWETYIRLGGADFELDNAFTGNRDFEDSFNPFGTLGIRGLVYQDALFGVGPFFQVSKVFSDFTDTKTGGNLIVPGGPATEKILVRSPWDFGFGMSAQIKPAEWLAVYAGPYAYWTRIRLHTVQDGAPTSRLRLKEKNNVGGLVGLLISPGRSFNAGVEGQFKTKKSSIGMMLTYYF